MLVIDMHGGGGVASGQMLTSGFKELADGAVGLCKLNQVDP
jgi:poly(3-hydroxybutyrate) depolymerase